MKTNLIKKLCVGICATAMLFTVTSTDVSSNVSANTKIATTVQTQTGVTVQKNAKASVDSSNLSEGFVTVTYTGGKQVKIKVQITKTGGTTYTYDLNNQGNPETFALTQGNGTYTIKIFENTSGTKYATAFTASVNVTLRNDYLPYLYPNQYVNYNAQSQTVAKAKEIIPANATDVQKVQAVFNYVTKNFKYDYDKAATVKSGYLPVVDTILTTQKGICFDYSSVMSSMLRSQGVPTKLVVGYAEEVYHAWINVYIEGTGWVDGVIKFDGVNWTMMDPTFISTGGHSDFAYKYTSTTTNYAPKYFY